MLSNKLLYIDKILNGIYYDNQCWIWKMSKNSDGYGNVWVDKKYWKAHRLSYLVFKGDIPEGLCVCHRCDNASCVNPEHLWLGTHKENMLDMIKKGRTLYAEQRSNNKIPSYKRPEIVKEYLSGKTQLYLSKKYNCHPSAIFNAIHALIPVNKIGFKGEKHPGAKLKESDIIKIRKSSDLGLKNKEISKLYNVTPQAINRIIKRIAWNHVP